MQVQQIMSQPVQVCHRSAALNEAARLMWECDCGAIPVVNDDHRLVGIVTDRDICMAAYTRGEPLQSIAVEDAMAKQVYSCSSTDSLESAEQLMSEHKVRRIPVVDEQERPLAMVSLNDIARTANGARSKSADIHRREVVATLAAICESGNDIESRGQAQARA